MIFCFFKIRNIICSNLPVMIWHLLDKIFLVFHTLLTVFNLTGWIWKKTRAVNLITLLITGASWLFLGLITGIPGYCPLTDWHFRVLEKMGRTDLPGSYIKYLADRLTGLDLNPVMVDRLTLVLFMVSLTISLFINVSGKLKALKKR